MQLGGVCVGVLGELKGRVPAVGFATEINEIIPAPDEPTIRRCGDVEVEPRPVMYIRRLRAGLQMILVPRGREDPEGRLNLQHRQINPPPHLRLQVMGSLEPHAEGGEGHRSSAGT